MKKKKKFPKKPPLTLKGCENILRKNEEWWRGEWQVEAVRSIVEHPRTLIQGPRQAFGKTFCMSVAGATMLFSSWVLIIGFPTGTQATRLLSAEIKKRLISPGDFVGGWVRKYLSKTTETKFISEHVNSATREPIIEGKLITLSAYERSISKPEGYTSDALFLDECHRYTEKTFGVFSPFLNVARREKRERFVLSGIGGAKSSLIEIAKRYGGIAKFNVVRYTADDLVRLDPSWEPVFAEEKEMLPEWQWITNYMVGIASEGLRRMYPLPLPVPDMSAYVDKNYQSIESVGIDVGRKNHLTHLSIWSKLGDVKALVDQFALPQDELFDDQANSIYHWLSKYYPQIPDTRMAIELNGMGWGLRDPLSRYYPNIVGITTDEVMKQDFHRETIEAARNKEFGIADPDIAEGWAELQYEVNERDGGVKYQHSDPWMSACVGWQIINKVERKKTPPVVEEREDTLAGYY